jgi:Cu+-exporting ATPase
MSKKTLLPALFLVFSVALAMAAVDEKTCDETLKCPVSGKEFTKSEASPKYEYEGKTYYFCCEGCVEKFAENPEKYIKKEDCADHAHDAEHANVAEHEHAEHADHDHQAHAEVDGTAVDPVCGMKVKKEDAKFTHVHNDKTYYFCNEECKDKFEKNPEKYAKK